MFNVLALARAGLSDGFLFPRLSEHYDNAMQAEAAQFDYDAAFESSIVDDLGIVDVDAILWQARAASHGGFSYELISDLYATLRLETFLRRHLC